MSNTLNNVIPRDSTSVAPAQLPLRQLQKLIIGIGKGRKTDKEDWLIDLVRSHQSSAIRRSAIVALRQLGSTKALPILISILTTEFENENLRESAIKALGKLGNEETAAVLHGLVQNETAARFGKQAARNALALLVARLDNSVNALSALDSEPAGEEIAMWDVFICHAWEDKEDVARPLANALTEAGLKVWYDEFTLTLGDSLRDSIDQGIAQSEYGVVILSPSFFAKSWPQRELNGLTSREVSVGKTILPIWHNIIREEIEKFSPTLADKFGVTTSGGLIRVVQEILRVLRPDRPDDRQASPDRDRVNPLAGRRASRPQGFESFRSRQTSTSSNPPDYSEGYVTIEISTPSTIFDVSVVSWHPEVYVHPLESVVQIPGGGKETLQLRVEWAPGDTPPEVLQDHRGRAFHRKRPRDPGQEWEPLYITFETEYREAWAAVTYFRVSRHSKGFPEVSMIGAPAPFDWVAKMESISKVQDIHPSPEPGA